VQVRLLGPRRLSRAGRPGTHEGLQARYIRALAGAGRQAEAVAAFQRVRERLDTTFSTFPAPPSAPGGDAS
jgi:hypothetical protein